MRSWVILVILLTRGCQPQSHAVDPPRPPSQPTAQNTQQNPSTLPESPDAGPTLGAAGPDAGRDAAVRDAAVTNDDPMALHRETKEDLLALFQIRPLGDKERKIILPDSFLHSVFGPDGPGHANQGNKSIATHTISKTQCLEGLANMVLQTDEQKAACGGEANMVPIHAPGKPSYFCADIFEFPNKACELPIVWIPPTYAKKVCELQGKRLCSQIEWQMACRGDPDNGPDSKYAYGEKLDLDVCHTSRPHHKVCDTTNAKRSWETCTTDSEPSGSFPKCRSRFGLFDQHGNVAEIMMRRDADGEVVSQLKGSAWFYAPISREPGVPAKPSQKGMETYPDHCNFDPRWHVEPIANAWHINYHLGFRCCKSYP